MHAQPRVSHPLWTLALAALLGAALAPRAARPQDGPPAELGPMDVHEVDTTGTNQPILVIYAQADDHRILATELAGLNTAEDDKVSDLADWFDETSWGATTFAMDPQRAAGNTWYVLPEGILDYASPSDIRPIEFRDAALASAANPTPPASVAALAAAPGMGDPASAFDTDDGVAAGEYRYAVSGFRNGVESTLTRVPGTVTVAAGDVVTLTITKAAANDVDRFLVYRTGAGQADALGNYRRIGYAEVGGATSEYVDRGAELAHLADHSKLLTDAMEAADPDVADFEAYNGVIVILHSSFLRGQAAGAQTFTVNGTSFKIQTINQSNSTGFGRFTHEMGHWLGLPDQYDPVTAGGRGYWTTMDGANDREYAGWEKDFKLAWIVDPGNVRLVERPDPGDPDFVQAFQVTPTAVPEMGAGTFAALKLESSDGVHYYVEGRNSVAGNVSDALATDHVVVMEAVDAWPPGIYPKRTLNEQAVLASGDPTHSPDPTVEISYTGVNAGPPRSYDVEVRLKAGPQPDPRITPWGAPPWETTDVWVDSEREGGGWDDPATAMPKPDNGEAAWVNHVNRVYARIANVGEGDATGVQVRFQVNTPGGMGDAGQFVDLPMPAPIDIPAGESRNVYAEWTPTVGEHTCIKVEIEHQPGEASIHNNFAQENVNHFYSGSESPWHPVEIPVRVANPFDEPRRVDLEISGLGTGWRAGLEHKWVQLEPETFKTVQVTITPPEDAERCTRRTLDLYAMTRIDDYIQTYGGINPIIHLANPIRFPRLDVRPIQRGDPIATTAAAGVAGAGHFRVTGLIDPPLHDVEIAVIVTDPLARDRVYFDRTDGGAFEVEFPAPFPGIWTAYAYYAGDDCNAPTESGRVRVVSTGAGLPGGASRLAYSFHVGSTHPLGDLDDVADANIYAALDAAYRLTDRIELQAVLGLAQLTAESASGIEHPRWVHASLNARFTTTTPSGLRPYLRAGGGAYDPKSGATEPGVNLGLGAQIPVAGPFAIEFGADLHQVDDEADSRFVTVQLGVQFR